MTRLAYNPTIDNSIGLQDVATVKQGGTGTSIPGEVPSIFNILSMDDINQANGAVGLNSSGKISASQIPTGPNNVLMLDVNGQLPAGSYTVIAGGSGVMGLKSVPAGSTNTYTITDYDAFTDYVIAAIGGVVSRSGDTITYTAPAITGDGGFIINGKTFNIAITSSAINTPSILTPVNNSTEISLRPTFTSTAFGYSGAVQTQSGVVWELATDPGFVDVIASYQGSENLNSWTIQTSLTINTTYYARVRYQGNLTGWGDWSSVVSFTTVLFVGWVGRISSNSNIFTANKIAPNGTAIYAGGYSTATNNAYITKWDTAGNLIWQYELKDGLRKIRINDLIISSDSLSIYAICDSRNISDGEVRPTVIKIDANGNLVWQYKYEYLFGEFNTVIATAFNKGTLSPDSNSLYFIGSVASAYGGNPVTLVVKIDTSGNILWQKTTGGSSGEGFSGIAISPDGLHIYVAGTQGTQATGYYDGYITKWTAGGVLVWQKSIGAVGYTAGYSSINISPDGSYLYASGGESSGGNNGIISKWDIDGNLIWNKILTIKTIVNSGGSFRKLALSPDGTAIYTAGDYYPDEGTNNHAAHITKWDTNGNLLWQKALGGAASYIENWLSVDVTPDNTSIYTVGQAYPNSIIARVPADGAIILAPLTGPGLTTLAWLEPTFQLAPRSHTVTTPTFVTSNASLTRALSSNITREIITHSVYKSTY